MKFISPTYGPISLETMVDHIAGYVAKVPDNEYRLVIGTDSHSTRDTMFITAIIVHRVGKGARYFYRKIPHKIITSLRQKIYYETIISLDIAGNICSKLIAAKLLSDFHVEIHVDIGPNGSTRSLIKEIVGMVVANGYEAYIKPDAYGASKVADKHSKLARF